MTDETVVVSSSRQTAADLGTDVAVLHLEKKVYYTLSGSARWVWEMLREPVKVADVISRLGERYEVEPERCRREVLALLEQLLAAGLVETRTASDDGRRVTNS